MRCIEIRLVQYQVLLLLLININIRCIEIPQMPFAFVLAFSINRNMRCIEIKRGKKPLRCIWINRNMRCIEMTTFQFVPHVLND